MLPLFLVVEKAEGGHKVNAVDSGKDSRNDGFSLQLLIPYLKLQSFVCLYNRTVNPQILV